MTSSSFLKRFFTGNIRWNCIHTYGLLGLLLFLISNVCSARAIIIGPNTIIDKDTTYQHAILDLTHGSFIITQNASLTIENSMINGDVSPENPYLIQLSNGVLNLNNNTFNIIAKNITPAPNRPSLYYVISIIEGGVNLVGNLFKVDQFYTVGLLSTKRSPTSNINFKNNRITNFHGGILLRNSNHALISDNRFSRVSSSNIFIIEGNDNLIKGNVILFSGNNNVGDGIDITDSNNIVLLENYISSGSCYSVVILRGKNILIDHNRIMGGITYAIYITPSVDLLGAYHDYYASLIGQEKLSVSNNQQITVTNNYLAQNRFGLAANNVDGLTVTNNIFIQRFLNNDSRKFWTNNDILFKDTINITWYDNLYKEAFPQELEQSGNSSKFVLYPLHGGVIL